MQYTLQQWLALAGSPYTEKRGERTAVCVHGLLLTLTSKLYDLSDYAVWAVCGPYVELIPRKPNT